MVGEGGRMGQKALALSRVRMALTEIFPGGVQSVVWEELVGLFPEGHGAGSGVEWRSVRLTRGAEVGVRSGKRPQKLVSAPGSSGIIASVR